MITAKNHALLAWFLCYDRDNILFSDDMILGISVGETEHLNDITPFQNTEIHTASPRKQSVNKLLGESCRSASTFQSETLSKQVKLVRLHINTAFLCKMTNDI